MFEYEIVRQEVLKIAEEMRVFSEEMPKKGRILNKELKKKIKHWSGRISYYF